MIDLPHGVLDEVFDKEVKKGTVIKTKQLIPEALEDPHYYIAVNRYPSSNPLLFVVCTSQTDFYERYPSLNNEILRISKNRYDFFSLSTIVDCRTVFSIQRSRLKYNYQEEILEFCGKLVEGDVVAIERIIKKSRLISDNDKRLILGPHYNK